MIPVIIASIESPEDRDLMTDFYVSHQMLMYHEAWKYLKREEDVEDIVYEALTKIIEKMETFRSLKMEQRVQYALSTVRNLSYLFLKRNNHFFMVSFDTIDYEMPEDDGASAESVVERKQFESFIRKVWAEIDCEERMLLEQKYILKWKDEELAMYLGIKPQSVRMRLTRAKRHLLEVLQKKGINLLDWLPD